MHSQNPTAAPAPEPAQAPDHDCTARPAPRLRRPDRSRPAGIPVDLLPPEDDLARLLWPLVESLDFSAWLADVRAVQGGPGRDANDPRLLFALLLYGALDGVGSAREVHRLCSLHVGYAWLAGGVPVNHHSLSD